MPREAGKIGASGHTWTVTGEHGTVRSRLWRDGALVEDDFRFEDISDYLEEEGCLVWVDICDPDVPQLEELARELTLDPLAVEDSLTRVGRTKATRCATHTFLTAYATAMRAESPDTARVAHAGSTTPSRGESEANQGRPAGVPSDADLDDSVLVVSRVSAFVLRRGVVTIRQGGEFDIEKVVRRWEDNADLLKFGVGALVYGLLDFVVDGHFEAVQAIDDSIESLEDGLFDDRAVSREVQRRTYRIRKDLVELRRVVLPMREVINSVLRHRRDLNAPAELDPWYDDLYDHVLRASEWTESLRDMVTTIFETNLSLQDARLNTVMKKLTSWAAIIAVPTAVTGFFGQNVPYPGYGHTSGFILSSAVIVAMAGLLYVGFRRRDWL